MNRKIHRIMASFLGLFILLHFGVHLSAFGGHEWHIKSLSVVQILYRNWLIEPILIIAILAQIYTGVGFIRRRLRLRRKTVWHWAQIISGGYIAFFMLNHMAAALMAQYIFALDTNFYWAAGTLTVYPLMYFFAPYYFLGVLSLFVHLACVLHFKGRKMAGAIAAFGAGLGMVILLPFTGWLFEINLPAAHQDYFANYLQLLGL